MSPDAPWIERAVFYGLHLHNSWLFLPVASLACFALLLLLRRLSAVGTSAYRFFLVSFGVLPLVIYSVKDVCTMLAHASDGYVRTLKYAYQRRAWWHQCGRPLHHQWAASFALQAMSPIPANYTDDTHWAA